MIDGQINAQLEGKTVVAAYKDGTHLILRLHDGHEVRIKWVDGEPILAGVDVRISIALPGMTGTVFGL